MKRFILPMAIGFAIQVAAPSVWADSRPFAAAEVSGSLADVMQFDRLLHQMINEAMKAGLAFEGEVFPAQPEGLWRSRLENIYDFASLSRKFTLSLEITLQDQPEVRAAALSFYGSEAGGRVLEAELQARQDFLEEEEVEAAEVAVQRAEEQGDPRLVLIDEIIAAADLLDRNVLVSLNDYRLFERGYDEALPLADRRSSDEITGEAASTEPDVRAQSKTWLRAFFYWAYREVPEKDLRAILAYYLSPEGRAMLDATFRAYDAAFDEATGRLGKLVGRVIAGQLI